jgi:hypothetical protein
MDSRLLSGPSQQMNRRSFLRLAGVASASAWVAVPRPAPGGQEEPVYDLAPTPKNPRNSEGAFLTLKSGQILFCYTQFEGGSADESPARIVSITSGDDGRTWSREPQLVVENPAAANVMSVSLLRLPSGRVALFYLVKNSLLDCRAMMRISSDETASWSDPQPVGSAPGYFVLNNDRVIQLRSGRLVAPLAFHRSRSAVPKGYGSWDSRAIALWYLSDDEGKTWREAEDWWALPVRSKTGLQEPGVVELADGRVFSWARTDQGAQFGCYSGDEGAHWPLPERTALQSPASPASIKRLPGSSDLLAVFNDHSGQFPFTPGKRTPLVAARSGDGGKTWPKRSMIESDPGGWYCYTAIHFTERALLLAYCAGDSKVGGLNRLRLRRMSLEELETRL